MKRIIQKLILICLCLVLIQPISVYAEQGSTKVKIWAENDSVKLKADGLDFNDEIISYKILFFSNQKYNNEDYEICIDIKNYRKGKNSLKNINLEKKMGFQIWRQHENDSWEVLSDKITGFSRNTNTPNISCIIKDGAADKKTEDIYVLVKTTSENIILPLHLAKKLYNYTWDTTVNQCKDPEGNPAKIYYASVDDTNITLYTKTQEIARSSTPTPIETATITSKSTVTPKPTETPKSLETPAPTVTPGSTVTTEPTATDIATLAEKITREASVTATFTKTPKLSETPVPTQKSSVTPTPEIAGASHGKGTGKFIPLIILLGLLVFLVILFILKKPNRITGKKVDTQKKPKSAPKSKAEPKKETKPQSPIKESSLEDEDTLTPFEAENFGQQKKVTKPVPQKHKKFTVYSAVMNNKGRVRKNNEDNFYLNGTIMQREKMDQGAFITCTCKEPVQLYAVCDGMGGNENGEDASFGAVSSLQAENKEKTKSYDKKKFTSTLQNYSDSLYRNSRRKGYKSGTTIVAASIQNEKLLLVNVGDSRIYRFRGNQLKQMTVDHSRVQKLISLGMIAPEEAHTHPERHVITQYLGMNVDIRLSPYYVSETVEKNDIYLLCSDGLTDMVTDQQLESILTEQSNPKELVQTLVKTALHNGGRDNVTAMVLVIG